MLDELRGESEFGCGSALIGWDCRDGRGSPPQTEAADPPIGSDGETDMTDRTGQSEVCWAVVVPVMRTELQQ